MYRITVKSLKGALLHFTVETYEVEDGFVTFKDRYGGEIKRFAASNTEIEEVK